MKVEELIKVLQTVNKNADLHFWYDYIDNCDTIIGLQVKDKDWKTIICESDIKGFLLDEKEIQKEIKRFSNEYS